MHHPGGNTPSRARGAARTLRRAGALAVPLLFGAAAWASTAEADMTVGVAGDSVLVSGHAAVPTTIRVTRPDAITHKPVVIGQYAGDASSLPFTVNATVPSALDPDGDCWQAGALASAVTPDLQPGDTVTVTQTPSFGQATAMSVPVTADAVKDAAGPIPGCDEIAPFARNATTTWTNPVTGAITVSGAAQPFATGVSVSATDGKLSTAPVAVRPAEDGSWSATIEAPQVGRLADGELSLAPVFEVPDVSTGATAHIAGGAPVTLSKAGPASSPGAPPKSSPPSAPKPGTSTASGRLSDVRVPARIGLRAARRKGIPVAVVVPTGAHVLRVRLQRGGKTLLQRNVTAGTAGSRQVVRLRGPRLRRVLRRGPYRVAVGAGPSATALATSLTARVRVH